MVTSRRRDQHGFTIVEMVAVLVLLGLLLAFALPKVVGSATFAEDQKAQTTASGALDSVVATFISSGERDGEGCTTPSTDPTVARTQMDAGPYPADGQSLTSCPVFANAASLGAVNGDVRFVSGDQPSTSNAAASVAAVKYPDGWRVAVAVLAPRSGVAKDSVSSCWIAWHQFPDAAGGTSKERYFTRTNVDAGDATNCTGDTALAYDIDSYCATGPNGQPLGFTWRRPCPDYAPAS